MRFTLTVSTIVLVVLLGTCHGCLEHERNALLQLFSYFNIHSSNFMNTTNCCDWKLPLSECVLKPTSSCYYNIFVDCNDTAGRVTDLVLDIWLHPLWTIRDLYLNTSMFLPFKGLRNLELTGLEIVGFAENEGFQKLSKLKNLESLDLSNNILNNSFVWSEGLCELRHLRSLSLSNNDLNGSLPWCLANMTFLQNLDLSYNHISGDISFSPIKNLTYIQWLDVRGNRFKVPISLALFFNHSGLKYLDVQENELYAQREVKDLSPKFQLETLLMSSPVKNATYPEFLYHQHSLREVNLSHIQFMGEFPYWLLENNTDLETLLLSNNSLSGPLQLPIYPHVSLSTLDISRNSIHGHIPSEFGERFPRLTNLNMSTNALIDSIPSSFGMLTALTVLDLSNNKLCGGIEEGLFMNMTKLQLLNLGGNQISGKIPDSLFHLFYLNVLDISHNNLSGHIPEGIGSLSSLQILDLSKNNLSGHIPEGIGSLSSLKILDLSKNNLSGPLPTNFCLPQMSQLKLSNNKLFGSLTEVFCDCRSLITLDLGHNHFTGNIPDWIHRCSQLKFLLLSHNNLQGKIPIQLCALDQLNLIDLSNNNLLGRILPCLRAGSNSVEAIITLSEEQRSLEFTDKNLSQIYQASILKYIPGIDLSCNNLTGEIPPEIGNLSKIQVLNLSYNSLTGPIPVMFVNLKQIESLDLSYNKLYGQIPSQLTELTFLAAFSVAHNNLSGVTPAQNFQFATFNESSYEGNPLLCGKPLPKRCDDREPSSLSMPRTEEESKEDNGFMDMEAFYVSFLVSYVMVLLVIAAVLYINPYWRRLCFAFIEATTSNFYYFLLDHLPLLSKFGLS